MLIKPKDLVQSLKGPSQYGHNIQKKVQKKLDNVQLGLILSHVRS
uniref:Uncharacterized protein n=1 Tax=Rhizophora mucronata TaxID=61149 RepID=A0A2P2Q2P1_RHIMU